MFPAPSRLRCDNGDHVWSSHQLVDTSKLSHEKHCVSRRIVVLRCRQTRRASIWTNLERTALSPKPYHHQHTPHTCILCIYIYIYIYIYIIYTHTLTLSLSLLHMTLHAFPQCLVRLRYPRHSLTRKAGKMGRPTLKSPDDGVSIGAFVMADQKNTICHSALRNLQSWALKMRLRGSSCSS